jgi:hypothetical protein
MLLASRFTATLMIVGALTVSSTPSWARIVCDQWGQCWHVHVHNPHYQAPYYQGYGWTYQPYQWRGPEEGEVFQGQSYGGHWEEG